MQAAVHVPSSPILKIENNFEIPKPGPDQVLIEVQASGVCHSDVSIHHNGITKEAYLVDLPSE